MSEVIGTRRADLHSDGGQQTWSATIVSFVERWCPDAFVFVLLGVVLVVLASILHGSSAAAASIAFGKGFWTLIPFTMQMVFVALGGYVVASSPPVARTISWLARIPKTPRGAVAFVAFVSIFLSMINWGLSIIFSGFFVREIARRKSLRLDYRAAGAAGYLGLGCMFTLGITSSAAQLQANASSIPASLLPISGIISFDETLLTWQNLLTIIVVSTVSIIICYVTAPGADKSVTAEDLNVSLDDEVSTEVASRPGELFEFSPILTVLVVACMIGWLWETMRSGNPLITLSGLNTYNLIFLMLGLLLHWRPRSFLNAFGKGVPAISGVLLQYPFYAGIAYVLTKTPNAAGVTLSDSIAHAFVGVSRDPSVFSVLMSLYSGVLGFFIPSAGGKWILEAPYLLQAANEIHAHLGWTLMVYNLSETLPNFLNPFWMLPLLGVLGLKAKDLIGYSSMQFCVHFPIVMILGAVLMRTFTYHPPIMP